MSATPTQSVVVSLITAAVLALGGCAGGDSAPAPPATSDSPASAPPTEHVVGPLTPADAEALGTMNDHPLYSSGDRHGR